MDFQPLEWHTEADHTTPYQTEVGGVIEMPNFQRKRRCAQEHVAKDMLATSQTLLKHDMAPNGQVTTIRKVEAQKRPNRVRNQIWQAKGPCTP